MLTEIDNPNNVIISFKFLGLRIAGSFCSYMYMYRPRGLMDKASDFGSEDCEFESHRGHILFRTSFGEY